MSGNSSSNNNKSNSSNSGGMLGKSNNDSLSGRVKTWFFSTSLNDQQPNKPGMGSGGGLGMAGGGGGPLGGGGAGGGGGPLGNSRGTSTDLRGMNVWMPQTL